MKRIVKIKSHLVLLAFSLVFIGCGAGKDKTQVEFFTGMWDQISHKSQDWNPNNPKNPGTVMEPPANTIPIGYKPYPYDVGEIDKAGRELKNPLAGRFDPEVLLVGQKRYSVYCGVCHGEKGMGDGPVASKMIGIKPPSLVSDKLKSYPDGRFYHVITRGYGTMGSYSKQIIDENDRWAVVNYIRKSLQKK